MEAVMVADMEATEGVMAVDMAVGMEAVTAVVTVATEAATVAMEAAMVVDTAKVSPDRIPRRTTDKPS